MEYIHDSMSLHDLLKDPNNGTRLLTEELDDKEVEIIYRQMANFMLQLFKIDFDHIGSIHPLDPKLRYPVRPLT